MPIPIPVPKTKIATVPWGIPITNEVNRLTTVTTPTAWTNVTAFLNGWVAYAGLRAPRYRKIGDIVYVEGLVRNGTVGAAAFIMPTGFRSNDSYTIACVSNSLFGYISVNPDGSIVPQVGASAWFSLVCQFPTT